MDTTIGYDATKNQMFEDFARFVESNLMPDALADRTGSDEAVATVAVLMAVAEFARSQSKTEVASV
jgi:hypothetical protein